MIFIFIRKILKCYKIFSSIALSLNKTQYPLCTLNLSELWKSFSELRNSNQADSHITLNIKSYVQLIFWY